MSAATARSSALIMDSRSDKITVFADRAGLDDSTNQGFANLGDGKYAIRWNNEVCECELDAVPAELREVILAYEA